MEKGITNYVKDDKEALQWACENASFYLTLGTVFEVLFVPGIHNPSRAKDTGKAAWYSNDLMQDHPNSLKKGDQVPGQDYYFLGRFKVGGLE